MPTDDAGQDRRETPDAQPPVRGWQAWHGLLAVALGAALGIAGCLLRHRLGWGAGEEILVFPYVEKIPRGVIAGEAAIGLIGASITWTVWRRVEAAPANLPMRLGQAAGLVLVVLASAWDGLYSDAVAGGAVIPIFEPLFPLGAVAVAAIVGPKVCARRTGAAAGVVAILAPVLAVRLLEWYPGSAWSNAEKNLWWHAILCVPALVVWGFMLLAALAGSRAPGSPAAPAA